MKHFGLSCCLSPFITLRFALNSIGMNIFCLLCFCAINRSRFAHPKRRRSGGAPALSAAHEPSRFPVRRYSRVFSETERWRQIVRRRSAVRRQRPLPTGLQRHWPLSRRVGSRPVASQSEIRAVRNWPIPIAFEKHGTRPGLQHARISNERGQLGEMHGVN